MGRKLEILILSWILITIIGIMISLCFNNMFKIGIIDLIAVLLINTVILIKIMKGVE